MNQTIEKENVLLSVIGESDLKVIIENCVRKVMLELKEDAPQIDEFLTSHQLCSMLHISMSTIVNWRKTGKLKPHKIGGKILFKREDILTKIAEIRQFRSVELS
ncbi:MAG: helix-turn-helix domain-containing protein [Ignavibacteria bacterium]|nr:helix-turn-helix domain-containing protein [Ignavibacteria bacterium]